MELWDDEGFGRVASTIGTPLFIDKLTETMTRTSYARRKLETKRKNGDKVWVQTGAITVEDDEQVRRHETQKEGGSLTSSSNETMENASMADGEVNEVMENTSMADEPIIDKTDKAIDGQIGQTKETSSEVRNEGGFVRDAQRSGSRIPTAHGVGKQAIGRSTLESQITTKSSNAIVAAKHGHNNPSNKNGGKCTYITGIANAGKVVSVGCYSLHRLQVQYEDHN
ncbi:hypothetical protein FRX31_031988 [Thalictrum thalictroides]|uniref:Uncharacterized protein n=1 Tax=Thalictrum thalictroides TaxID=46969 RepID=A0A7J6V151_THATH|nr:hypothetical protein FRX31_031988 [Thalictrum thalictroides]